MLLLLVYCCFCLIPKWNALHYLVESVLNKSRSLPPKMSKSRVFHIYSCSLICLGINTKYSLYSPLDVELRLVFSKDQRLPWLTAAVQAAFVWFTAETRTSQTRKKTEMVTLHFYGFHYLCLLNTDIFTKRRQGLSLSSAGQTDLKSRSKIIIDLCHVLFHFRCYCKQNIRFSVDWDGWNSFVVLVSTTGLKSFQ